MVEVYGIRIDTNIDENIFYNLLELVSLEKRKKIKRYRFFEDSHRCLLGDILARYAICIRLGVNNNKLKFGKNEYGKPILLEPAGIHFNISHSGNWVVCALSDKPIGIDIEVIKPIEFSIAKRFFSKDEYNDLLNQGKDQQLEYFYMLWTLKESYIKAVGKGLYIPLNTFTVRIENSNISIDIKNKHNPCYFEQYKIDKGHIIAVCIFNEDSKLDMHDIKIIIPSHLLTLKKIFKICKAIMF